MSAVEMLRLIGENNPPDFKGKRVVVVGGGNVAMDVARSSVRLGAENVYIAYRRRKSDMTALPEEVEGAIAEGCEVLEMYAPDRVKVDENNNCVAMCLRPQMAGAIDRSGRPSPVDAPAPIMELECDIVVVAIGQNIQSEYFAENGIPCKWGTIVAGDDTIIENVDGVFSGGDCVTGPATVIRAIAAGKVAAANIDEYLGFAHELDFGVTVPEPTLIDRTPCGRCNTKEREAADRKNDFTMIEFGLSDAEAKQEALRCLRCDKYGLASLKGGRL
jgi:NADPH-dependent glutamate synthase beta subunit-like oxidoreductase